MFREKRSLIGSKGLLYTVGPVDELCFLTLLKQALMVKQRRGFERSTITEAWADQACRTGWKNGDIQMSL